MSAPKSNDLPQSDDHDSKSSGGESKRRKLTTKEAAEPSKPRGQPTDDIPCNSSNTHQPHNGRPFASSRCRKMLFAQLKMTSVVASPAMPHCAKGSSMDNDSREGSKQHPANYSPSTGCTKTQSGRRIYEVPVNVASIGASGVIHAVHNVIVRHDFIFDSDPDLQIQAHHAGHAVHQKQAKADEFWEALTSELGEFVASPSNFQASMDLSWTLPSLLKSVQQMLLMVVRPELGQDVREMLDVELIMQELVKGVANLDKLASHVASFLKTHCAPMRDKQVDQMLTDILSGNRNGDLSTLVRGLQNLLKVVEAMILDIVNHQVRCVKAHLIRDAVDYERKYFMKLVAQGMDLRNSREWYDRCESICAGRETEGPAEIFFEGLCNYLRPGTSTRLIPTLTFDTDRIYRLRAEVLEAINVEVCLHEFDRYVTGFQRPRTVELNNAWASGKTYLRSRIIELLSHFESSNQHSVTRSEFCTYHDQTVISRWQNALPDLAAEIMRAASQPLSSFSVIESQLRSSLSNPRHPDFESHRMRVFERLRALFSHCVYDFGDLSDYNLHLQAAKSPRGDWDTALHPEDMLDMLLRNIVRKATHLSIHHMRVWEHIAYTDISADISDLEPFDDYIYGHVVKDGLDDIGSIVRGLSDPAALSHQLQVPQLLASELPDDAISELGDAGLAALADADETAADVADKTPKSKLPKKKEAKRQNSVCGEETEKTTDDSFKQEK